MIGSTGFNQSFASFTVTNFGFESAGIPSLGGPPEKISLYGTDWTLSIW
jgi:hypothetical protein